MSKNLLFFFSVIALLIGVFAFMPAGMIPVAVAGVARILFPILLGLGLVACLVAFFAGLVRPPKPSKS